MTFRQALISTLHLFVVSSFFLAGLFFVSLPHLGLLRVQTADIVLGAPDLCQWIGIALFSIAFLLFVGFYSLSQGKFLRLSMGRHLTEVDESVIRSTVEGCFQEKFPQQISLERLEILGSKRLELTVALFVPLESEEVLVLAEKELTKLLQSRFGYNKSFSVVIKN